MPSDIVAFIIGVLIGAFVVVVSAVLFSEGDDDDDWTDYL